MLDLLQWPALAVTVAGGWLALSDARDRRLSGFAFLLLAIVLWAIWSLHVGAWALFALMIVSAVPAVRGITENRRARLAADTPEPEDAPSPWSERADAEYAALVREGLRAKPPTEAPSVGERATPRALTPTRERRAA